MKHQTALSMEVASKEVVVIEAKGQAMVEYKESKEFKLTTQDYEGAMIKVLRRFSSTSDINATISITSSQGRLIESRLLSGGTRSTLGPLTLGHHHLQNILMMKMTSLKTQLRSLTIIKTFMQMLTISFLLFIFIFLCVM